MVTLKTLDWRKIPISDIVDDIYTDELAEELMRD